jgi:hypothetical protein
MRLTLILALLPTLAFAQSPAPHPEDLGTVTGHITCADTQRPARFAGVHLVPVKSTGRSPAWSLARFDQTDLTGAYTLRDIRPGDYYLSIYFSGYVNPIERFSSADLQSPTPKIQQRMQHELQLVTVTPHASVEADATLYPGATISGTVLYDDGSPAVDISINVLRHDANGESVFSDRTDSHGHYSIDSLPSGDYAIEASLDVRKEEIEKMMLVKNGQTVDTSTVQSVFSLYIYSGSVFRRKDAAIIKAEEGHDTDDADITIPISKLHSLSGTLTAKDGHPINAGRVDLLYSDTQEEFTGVSVSDDGTFHLPYIPEGNYILAVGEAKDIARVDIPAQPGIAFEQIDVRTLCTYGTLQQPLTVQADIQSLNLILPDAPTTAPPNNPTGDN